MHFKCYGNRFKGPSNANSSSLRALQLQILLKRKKSKIGHIGLTNIDSLAIDNFEFDFIS